MHRSIPRPIRRFRLPPAWKRGMRSSVMDRGPGIGPDELERVFEKFYRGRRIRAKTEGTGMGLAIAKGIIEAHGGKIRAENRQGGGAAVVISLPLQSVTA